MVTRENNASRIGDDRRADPDRFVPIHFRQQDHGRSGFGRVDDQADAVFFSAKPDHRFMFCAAVDLNLRMLIFFLFKEQIKDPDEASEYFQALAEQIVLLAVAGGDGEIDIHFHFELLKIF